MDSTANHTAMSQKSPIISSNSLAGRLTRWIMATVFIILSIITFMIYWLAKDAMIQQSEGRSHGIMSNTNENINGVLHAVEIAIANTVPDIEGQLDNPDNLYNIVERILRLNPDIVGSAIAFEPNYYPQKGVFFSPYAYYTDSTTIAHKQLGSKDYEYHHMDWYQMPKLQRKPYWSDPYFDSGGGEMTMATYSLPLFNSRGEMYAVVTADISLDWLTKRLQEIDEENNKTDGYDKFSSISAYSFIIGRSGTYIVHPDKERILSESYFTYSQETKDTLDDHIGYEMIHGKRGMSKFIDDGKPSFIFYTPIERTGWSMAIVVPERTMSMLANILGAIIILLMVLGLIVLFFVCRSTIHRITRPLMRFASSADEIAKGNLTAPLPVVNTKDEMMQLHNSFEMMQKSLVHQIEETKNVNEAKGRMESELQIARNIQMSMLPKVFPPFPDRNDLDIYALLTPAKEVGGDLYDFFIRDEKLFLCIGDVSGKGVPASLVMAVTRALFRTIAIHESNPAKIAESINEIMSEDNGSNMFVTMFVGVLDLPTGRLRYCNAGHCAPLLVGVGAGLLPVTPNIPLGIAPKYKMEVQEALICYGTTMFFYTDGLTEAENAEHELFGEERMLTEAYELYGQHTYKAHEMIKGMEQSVKEFVGGADQSDDMTMMAIQYLHKQKDERMQRSITLSNDIEEVPKLAEFVDEVCEELGLEMSLAMQMNLAIEEAVVNVMTYAYPAGTIGNVNIEAYANDERLKFVIIDSGIPFDPTVKKEVDTTLSAEDRPIGGLGIHLVRQLMDSINYERTNGQNVLTLRKKLN